jgi:hypothetical protein
MGCERLEVVCLSRLSELGPNEVEWNAQDSRTFKLFQVTNRTYANILIKPYIVASYIRPK